MRDAGSVNVQLRKMELRFDELTKRPIYVYDIPDDVLANLRRKDAPSVELDTASISETAVKPYADIISKDEVSGTGAKACSLCAQNFQTIEDQRGHIRSDFHNFNLKQKLRGQPPVSETEFELLVADLDESLSGTDSSESDGDDEHRQGSLLSNLLRNQVRITTDVESNPGSDLSKKRKGTQPLYWFTSPVLPANTSLGIYRAIFTNEEQNSEAEIVNILKRKQLSPLPLAKKPTDVSPNLSVQAESQGPHVFLCMIGGGHFAAMVVSLVPKNSKLSQPGPLSKEATVLAHKTFHRYTTRRKQGGSQSANDSAKGNAHSAGAGIRRYNEAALSDEVRHLLSEWRSLIDSSELLFIRATGSTNRRTLFGPYPDQILKQDDARLRGYPFSTHRATQKELMRSFIELTRVKFKEMDEAVLAASPKVAVDRASKQSPATKNNKTAEPAVKQRSEEEEVALLHTSQIQTFIRRSKLPALLSYLKTNNLSADFFFYPKYTQQNYHTSTPLHLASSLNSTNLVAGLLLKGAASPALPNGDGKPAFDLASDITTRNVFRVARYSLGENTFDWDAAHVPAALSPEEAAERESRQRQEEKLREKDRRKAETERLKAEGPKVIDSAPLGKAAGRGRALALGQVQKTAQERREEESKGLTPEMRMKLERERRARAAEERIKRLAGSG